MPLSLLEPLRKRRLADQPLPKANVSDDAEKLATTVQIGDTLRRLIYLEREIELAGRKLPPQ